MKLAVDKRVGTGARTDKRYALVVIGRKSGSLTESSTRLLVHILQPAAVLEARSLLRDRLLLALEQAPLPFHARRRSGYSSNTTRSQLISCSHSFLGLMLPASSRPSRSWKEPK